MGFLDRLLGKEPAHSGVVAKERLQLVLVHDRVQISPRMLQNLKDELIETISRYLEIDREGVEIQLSQNRRESRLVVDIPIVGQRRASRGY
jgi:cell division topological specificity factor